MTRDELLQSGLLELYVADACTSDERREVERALAADPTLQREVDEIAAAVEQFAKQRAVEPPAHLRSKIVAEPPSASASASTSTFRAPVSVYLRAASIGLIIGLLPALYLI